MIEALDFRVRRAVSVSGDFKGKYRGKGAQQRKGRKKIPRRSAPEEQRAVEQRTQTLLQKVQGLTVAEKRMLAMRGGREARSILIKDTNKQIVMAVLDNPKIKEAEMEMFARSRSIPDEALRAITRTKEWMKNYGVLLAVVSNPKTPAGVAVPLLYGLKIKDLASLEKNRNIAEVIRTTAKKLFRQEKGAESNVKFKVAKIKIVEERGFLIYNNDTH